MKVNKYNKCSGGGGGGSYDEGYSQGKSDGVNEQKSKLESINITENGTYTKEDGYNHIEVNVTDLNGSYDEGYNQGKADVVANARDIEVTKNGQYGDGKILYKTINVNVIPKINLQKTGLRLGFSSFTEVPELADFEGITDMSSMFSECRNLQTIPLIDTSNVTTMNYMFHGCNNLTSIPALNAQSLNMPSYQGIFGFNELSKLTDFGGFLNLKCSLTNDGNLKRLPNLTYQSCINVLNGLYDFTGNGETPGSNQGQLKVHANFLTTVGDEISIGTAKGWVINA